MTNWHKRFLMVGMFLLVGVLLMACSYENDDNAAEGAGKDDGDGKQVVNLTADDKIPDMDSSNATDSISKQILGDTTEGLYRLGEDGEFEDGIAIDSEESSDGLTWTFTLRGDAEWENGDPVTAHDFEYSWKRAVDPETASVPGKYTMSDILKNGEEVNVGDKDLDELGVKAEDDYTLVVELKHPVPYLKSLLVTSTFLPLNEDFVEEQGDDFATSADKLLANGPFKLTEWESTADSWKLEKNDDYWDADAVSIDEFNYDVVKNPQVSVDLFEQGKVDRASLSEDLVDQYRSDDDFISYQDMGMFVIRLNQTHNEALANENIRAAMSRAIDKEALVDTILNDGSTPATGAMPSDLSFHPESDEDYRDINGDLVTYDADEAQEYWEKGLDELGMDEVEVELMTDDTETYKQMSEYLADQLETNLEGLTVDIKMVPFEQRLDLDKNMEYDLEVTGNGPESNDPVEFLDMYITDGGNNMGYSNDKFDELIAKAKEEGDETERYEDLLEAEKVLFDDAAFIPLYQKHRAFLQSPEFDGLIHSPIGKDFEYKWASFNE